MKRAIAVCITSLFVLTSLVACNQKPAGDTLAVVDPPKVFQTCEVCLEGVGYLQGLNTEMQEAVTGMQAELMAAEDQNAARAKFQETLVQYQEKIGSEQKRIATILNDAFLEVLEDYRAANNITVLLNKEQVLSSDSAKDVSDGIIAAMDAKGIDLALPAEDEAAPAEEPAEAPGEVPAQ